MKQPRRVRKIEVLTVEDTAVVSLPEQDGRIIGWWIATDETVHLPHGAIAVFLCDDEDSSVVVGGITVESADAATAWLCLSQDERWRHEDQVAGVERDEPQVPLWQIVVLEGNPFVGISLFPLDAAFDVLFERIAQDWEGDEAAGSVAPTEQGRAASITDPTVQLPIVKQRDGEAGDQS